MPRGRVFRIYRYDFVSATASTLAAVREDPVYYDRDESLRRVYVIN